MTHQKKIENWQQEIEKIRESERLMKAKNAARIKELQRMIEQERNIEAVENNKLIADVVRSFYGEFNEENIGKLSALLKETGHTIGGMHDIGVADE